MVLEARTSEATRWEVNAHFMTQADGTRSKPTHTLASDVPWAVPRSCQRLVLEFGWARPYVVLTACCLSPLAFSDLVYTPRGRLFAQRAAFIQLATTTSSRSPTTPMAWRASRQHWTSACRVAHEVLWLLDAQRARVLQPHKRPLVLKGAASQGG